MARSLPAGQKMWIAHVDMYEQVTVLEAGTRGHVFKTGHRPKSPHAVEDDDGNIYIVGLDQLHHTPTEASLEMARLARAQKLKSNPSAPGDEDEEEADDDSPDSSEGDDEDSEDDTEEE